MFERAGYKYYAEIVKDLMKNMQTDTDDSGRNTHNQTPPPSKQSLPVPQSPVFPPEPEQFPEPPQYATATGAKLLQKDDQLGTVKDYTVNIWG